MVWAARSEATLMASTSARRSRADSWLPRHLARAGARMTSGSATSGPSALLRSCATPPARTLNASIRLVAGQSLLHAALVQHARLHQLLPQPNALQRRGDLVAERRVGVDPVGIAEGDDAQQLVLERQRQDEEALPPVVGQRARRQQLAGGVLDVLALQQLAVPQAHRRAQHVLGRRPPRTRDRRCGRRRWADP